MLRTLYHSLSLGADQAVRWFRRRSRPPANVLTLHLQGEAAEEESPLGRLHRFFAPPSIPMRELVLSLREAEKDEDLKLLLVLIGPNDLGWGRAQEIREAILAFRAAGKRAVAFLEDADNLDYFLATACDQILFPPSGTLGLTGLVSEVMFFKGALDWLEVQPELLQAGRYKSAVEPYTRTEMSEAHRESVNELLDGLYQQLVGAIAEARGLEAGRVRELIDDGPYLAASAQEKNLADHLLYHDQLDDHLERVLGEPPVRVSLRRWRLSRRTGLTWRDPWRRHPGVAVVYATGVIHSGESSSFGGFSDTAGSDTLCRALRDARENEDIHAVVLRVDSPGGSGLASDLIWREVTRFRGAKPLVVSMGDLAASGGYYIAAPADRIFAEPGTLTGSIGVFAGKVNLSGLYRKLGLNKELVTRGRHADLHSDFTPFSESGRAKMLEEMDHFYRDFVGKAAEGRHRGYDEIEPYAQGRVWTGAQALERGLVDEFGGLRRSLEAAKRMAGIPEDEKTFLHVLPRRRRIVIPGMSFLFPLAPRLSTELRQLLALQPLGRTTLWAMLPFRLRIR